MELYYRIGTAGEQGLFESEKESYAGITIGAHVAAFGKTWVAGLLLRICKPYVVDPVTYVFAQDPKLIMRADEMRRSYGELVNLYGDAVRRHGGKRALRPADLSKQAIRDELVSGVLNFQATAFSQPDSAQTSLIEYLEEVGEPVIALGMPRFLIPPYFYSASLDDPWYDVNVELAQGARSLGRADTIAPVICLSERTATTEADVARIVDDYKDFRCAFVWISGLDEQRATQTPLYNYGKLVRGLTEAGVQARSFYGGPFSVALGTVGLAGVSPGICYSDWKDVAVKATGGGFPTRYYVPLTRAKVSLANAARFCGPNPDTVCGCEICTTLIPNAIRNARAAADVADAILRLSQEDSKRHFMKARAQESAGVSTNSPSSLAAILEANGRLAKRRNSHLFSVPNSHLEVWAAVLHRLG